MKRRLKYLSVFSLVLAAGCKGPAHKIDTEATRLTHVWVASAESSSSMETETLSWEEAQELLRAENPSIKRAVEENFRARRAITQVYKNLLPTVRLHATVNKRIQELDQISFDDIRWDLNLYSFLSGLVTLHRDVYATELTYIRSSLLLELTSREKVVELHRLFAAAGQIEAARQRLAENERVLRSLPSIRGSLESPQATLQTMRDQLRIAEEKLDEDLLLLFANPNRRYRLSGESVPPLDYGDVAAVSGDASHVGVLRRRLFAVELVGAEARVRGAKLRYWPDISLYLSSGPLWATESGETIWWSTEDLRLFTSVYLPLDINGQIRNRVRDSKVDLEFLKIEIALREAVLVSELEHKRRALLQSKRELAEIERKRTLIMQLVAIEGAENLGDRLRQWMDVESKRNSLLGTRAQLNSFFFFFDERFWASDGNLNLNLLVSKDS